MPSTLDNFSTISNSTKFPNEEKSVISDVFVFTNTSLAIGLSSEFDVLTIGLDASSGSPSIDAILFNNLIKIS